MLLSSVCEPWALRNAHMSEAVPGRLCGRVWLSEREESRVFPVLTWSYHVNNPEAGFPELPGWRDRALMWPVPVVGIILLWIIVVLRVHILAFEKHQPQYSVSGDCTPCFVHARQVLCPLSSSDFPPSVISRSWLGCA